MPRAYRHALDGSGRASLLRLELGGFWTLVSHNRPQGSMLDAKPSIPAGNSGGSAGFGRSISQNSHNLAEPVAQRQRGFRRGFCRVRQVLPRYAIVSGASAPPDAGTNLHARLGQKVHQGADMMVTKGRRCLHDAVAFPV
jgi:hypothetical protein